MIYDDVNLDALLIRLDWRATRHKRIARTQDPEGQDCADAAAVIRRLISGQPPYDPVDSGLPEQQTPLSRGASTEATEGNINTKESGTPANPI